MSAIKKLILILISVLAFTHKIYSPPRLGLHTLVCEENTYITLTVVDCLAADNDVTTPDTFSHRQVRSVSPIFCQLPINAPALFLRDSRNGR